MWRPFILIGLWTLLSAPVIRADDKADHLAIIVAKNSTLENLSTADLSKIFRGDKTKGADGVKFNVLMHDPGRLERAAALKSIYHMSEPEYDRYFLQAAFTGTVLAAPKTLPSAAAVKNFVAETPGAISYVRGSDLD